MMFIMENVKLIKDEMMSYLFDSSSILTTTPSPQAFLWASNLSLLPLFGGGGGIHIYICVWYTKRDSYNMLIGVLIASSLTHHRPHASSSAPH